MAAIEYKRFIVLLALERGAGVGLGSRGVGFNHDSLRSLRMHVLMSGSIRETVEEGKKNHPNSNLWVRMRLWQNKSENARI